MRNNKTGLVIGRDYCHRTIAVGENIYSESGRLLVRIEDNQKSLNFMLRDENRKRIERSVPVDKLPEARWEDDDTIILLTNFGSPLKLTTYPQHKKELTKLYNTLITIRKE